MKKNMITTILGLAAKTLITAAIAAVSSPEFMTSLQAAGVNPVYLAVAGGVIGSVKDGFTKDVDLGVKADAE